MELHRALEGQELETWFQPVVDLETGKIAGFESLVRWRHPERGYLRPGEFLPVAGEIGLLDAVDRGVIHQAAHRLGEWQQRFGDHLWISVNLSEHLLRSPGLIDYLEQVVAGAQVRPQDIRLEISEEFALSEDRQILALLEFLRARGFSLLIDDFGTGYSSLAALHRYPVDAVKIDRSFVQGLEQERRSGEVIRTVLGLAREWGLETVAEGVESPEHLLWLRLHGCRYGQGMLFAPAMPSHEVETLLQRSGPPPARLPFTPGEDERLSDPWSTHSWQWPS